MTQPLLEDPGSAFLASGDPEAFLRDNLPFTEPPTEDTPAEDHDFLKGVVLVAGAFMAWRLYALAQARREVPSPPMDPEGALAGLWRRHAPIWLRVAQPSIEAVMRSQGLSGQELQAVAVDYATRLGSMVHETSAAAVVAGYKEQLRRGINPTLSWMRAMEGYGLDERRLRSWVAQQAVQEGPISDLITPGARRALERAILARADVLGQTEAWHSREVAKSIVWMAEAQEGLLPVGTRKRWITADDELVCKICGPLHLQEAWLDQQFVLPNGQRLWAPGVHPNCRCELALVYPKLVFEKALGDDPFDRDQEGRFARQESRVRRVARPVPVKERAAPEVDVAEMLARAKDEAEVIDPFAETADPFAQELVGDPFAAGDPFAPTTDPFGSDPFAQDPWAQDHFAPRTTGRKRRIYILVNGELKEVEADELAAERDEEYQVFLPVDAFYAQQEAYRPYEPGQPSIDVPDHKVGDEIDFDEFSTQAAYEKHRVDRPIPMPVEGFYHLPEDHPNTIIRRLDDFYHYAGDLSKEEESMLERVQDVRDMAVENANYNRTEIVDSMDAGEIAFLYRNAGLHAHARQTMMHPEYARDDLKRMLLDGDVPEGISEEQREAIEEAFFWHLMENDADVEAAEAAFAMSNPDFRRVPQIFTFLDNHFDGYSVNQDTTAGRPQPYILGRYKVVGIRMHPVEPGVLGGMERENPRIRAWKEVILARDYADGERRGYDIGGHNHP